MIRVFDDSEVTRNAFHFQIMVEMLPEKAITKAEGQALEKEIWALVRKRYPDIAGATKARHHQLASCDIMQCRNMPRIVELMDQHIHEEEGTEH